MFDIEYKGATTLVISTKNSSLVINPKLSIYGLKDIILKDKVELATEDKFLTNDENFKLNISYPGSYEVSDFSINGIAASLNGQDKGEAPKGVIYNVDVSGVKIGVLGNIAKDLTDDQMESLGVLDILILPVGGGNTLDATAAAMIARRSDANVIIPINYADPEIKYDGEQAELEVFTKELGLEVEQTTKYKIKSVANIPEKPIVMVINRSK